MSRKSIESRGGYRESPLWELPPSRAYRVPSPPTPSPSARVRGLERSISLKTLPPRLGEGVGDEGIQPPIQNLGIPQRTPPAAGRSLPAVVGRLSGMFANNLDPDRR